MISDRFYSNVNTYIIFHLFQSHTCLILVNVVLLEHSCIWYYSCNGQNYLLMVILILVMEINTFIKIMVNSGSPL